MCLPAQAFRFQIGEIEASWTNRVVVGATWRVEEREPAIIGKLNLNPDLCPEDCISFNGNPAPNQKLVEAPGAFVGANFDNGNLNYDQWDMTAGQIRIRSELNAFWGDIAFTLSGLAFYDFVNSNFEETHPDTHFQPGITDRPENIEEMIGHDVDILEAFVSIPFQLFDHHFRLSVGEQRIRWGESTFIARGSLDVINPPNANRLHFPGAQIASVFEPVGLVVLSTRLTRTVSVQLLYQYDWEPVAPEASGSFFSTNDIAGGGHYAVVGLGQFSEAPPRFSERHPQGTFKSDTAHLITDTYNSVPVNHLRGRPGPGGQYGISLTWFTQFNGRTEFSFYALNYHSRFPYASVTAANRSCLRDMSNAVPTIDTGLVNQILEPLGLSVSDLDADALSVLAACGVGGTPDSGTLLAEDALPLDTLGIFLQYPEDIHLFGISFNTNVGKWAIAGEYAFRPNQPVQISLPDVIFAGLQPALPAQDVELAIATVPSARSAIPDYVATRYRDNEVIRPGEVIEGFTRLEVSQFDITGIRIFSAGNWLGASQIIWLVEVGFTHVWDMPDRDRLQIDGGGPNCTHYSFGADGSGVAAAPTGPEPSGAADGADGIDPTQTFNPTQARGCFADDFAWGYRTLVRIRYLDLLFGWDVNPTVFFGHDVEGVAPFPIQNFVEGRKHLVLGTDVVFSPSWSAGIEYEIFWGSGKRRNMMQDRDNVTVSVAYTF